MDKIHVPNPDVLRAGIRHIEENVEQWHQDFWVATPEQMVGVDHTPCGTAGCLAAHILLAQGRTWDDLLDMVHGANGQQRTNLADLALEALGFGELRPKWNGGNIMNILWPNDEDEYEDGTSDADRFENRVFGYTYANGQDLAGSLDMLKVFKERIEDVTDVNLDDDPVVLEVTAAFRYNRAALGSENFLGMECDVCHGPMTSHDWATFNTGGRVVDCANRGYTFEV